MTEIIKVEIDEALAKRFRKKAMETYGYKKGSMKKALEIAIERFSSPGEPDWTQLKGVLGPSKVNSVELQHRVWRRQD